MVKCAANQGLINLLAGLIAKTTNEHRQRSLQRALRSLKAYPLPVASPREAQELDGIGPWVAQQLAPAFGGGPADPLPVPEDGGPVPSQRVAPPPPPSASSSPKPNSKPRRRPPKPAPPSPLRTEPVNSHPSTGVAADLVPPTQPATSQAPGRAPPKPYVPKFRSAAYAFLMALGAADPQALDAAQLIHAARPFSDVPLDPPKYRSDMEPQQFFQSGWQSLRGTLLPKGLVVKQAGRPLRYALTPGGRAVAASLQRATAAGLGDRPAAPPAPAAAPGETGGSSGTVPDGWELMRTPDGQEYFYHAANKTAQWHRPTAPPPAARPRLSLGRQCKPRPTKPKPTSLTDPPASPRPPCPGFLPGDARAQTPPPPPQLLDVVAVPPATPQASLLPPDSPRAPPCQAVEVIEIDDASSLSPTSLRGDDHALDFSEAILPMPSAFFPPTPTQPTTPNPSAELPPSRLPPPPTTPDSPVLFLSPSSATTPRPPGADRAPMAWPSPAATPGPCDALLDDWMGVMVLDPLQLPVVSDPAEAAAPECERHAPGVESSGRAGKRKGSATAGGPKRRRRADADSGQQQPAGDQDGPSPLNGADTSDSILPAMPCLQVRWDDGREACRCTMAAFLSSSSPLASTSASSTRRLSGPPIDFAGYDVVLVVDSRERVRGSRGAMCEALLQRGVPCESGCLQIGDFLWVARRRAGAAGGGPPEVVLDFIIERKKVSDLASSIPTGRYHSQKDRLGCSQVGHVMYLVEGDLREQQTLSPKAIASAVCSTMLGSGFHLLLSPNVEGTVRLLEGLTRAIRQCYVTQQIVLRPARAMSLATWNVFQSGNRQQTVGDVFLMMLQQVHGCSRDKAEAIQDAFPTPSALRHRYQALARAGQSAAAADGLLAGVTGDGSLRPLGLPASALLSQCFGGSS